MRKIVKVLFIFSFLLLLMGCGQQTGEKVWVYDTDQYQVYRRLASMCANAIPDGQIQEINENELTYLGDNIRLHVKTEGENTVIQAETEDGRLHTFEFPERPAGEIMSTGIKATYTDVTGDGNRDIVVIFSPVRGTMTGPAGAYLYDVAEDRELKLLEDGLYLSEEMLEEIGTYLDKDFYEVFPDFTDIHGFNAGGSLYVDKSGEVYYEAIVTDQSLIKDIGKVMVFLTYEKSADKFRVSDVIYMPLYVSEKAEGSK